ncbi:MAG: PIG-L family deacetylase, partial [Vicinamibacterales bacterium]
MHRLHFPMGYRLAAVSVAIGLIAALVPLASQTLIEDRGASGTWQKLLKLSTTASVMQVAAHPDEEAGGVMTWLSRLHGVRVASLTLTRGEGGDNAIGSEAFDALGLLRTEELLVSNRYYGVDEQYFTTAVDFGFTKRSNEAFDRWGRQQLLGEVVRVIRISRPLVLLSRFQGTARDGHGSTAASVQVMRDAFSAAADPAMFPEQLRDGLRPWQALKVYIGAAAGDSRTIVIDTGVYSPWLGRSYSEMARLGLGFQRSSVSPVNERRHYTAAGPELSAFTRMESEAPAAATEHGFFDGIDTSMRGVFRMLRKPEPAEAAAALAAIDRAVKKAQAAFTIEDPSATVPALAEGLTATRLALSVLSDADADVRALLHIKERQFQEAIGTALALDVTAIAQPAGVPDPAGEVMPFTPPPVMAAPVPGQRFEVRVRVTNRGSFSIVPTEIALVADRGWTITPAAAVFGGLGRNDSSARRFSVELADDVAVSSRPFFQRGSLRDARYSLSDPAQFSRAVTAPPVTAVVRYTVVGVAVEARRVVQRRESKVPAGDVMRELNVVPVLSVRVIPEHAVIPIHAAIKQVALVVELLNNHDGAISGMLALTLPAAWRAEPDTQAFRFEHAGERRRFSVTVTVPSIENRGYSITAVATVNGVRYSEGYDLIDQRDLELRYLYRPATAQVRGVDVAVVSNLSVGYVMGVGDQVPAGIAQLGYAVTQLKEADLAAGDLARFDVIVTGTRAYAVR